MRALLVLGLLGAAGCGPALRSFEIFTPDRVRDVQFNDQCKLQGYFDGNPAEPQEESESSVTGGRGRAFGRVIYLLEPGSVQSTFRRIVDSYYKDLPPLASSRPLRVTVNFTTSCQTRTTAFRQIPIGSRTELEWEGGTTSLPYHPCLSAFFFGRPYYEARRKLSQSM